jgi:protein-L-isoaspartate(D-aspartate) O-methyltransferase
MNIEIARLNMIEQQIRTWDVLDQSVLDLLGIVKREGFVDAPYQSLAFVDMELPLPGGEFMFSPKLEARLVQDVAIKPGDVVLEIGTGSGYLAALLASQAQSVTTVEIVPEILEFASKNLERAGIANVTVQLGDGARGWSKIGSVDVLVVSGSLPLVPPSLLAQLKIGGRLWAIVGDDPIMSAQLITRMTDTSWDPVKLFETTAKPLRNAVQPERFEF